jgi:hypothetical protein
VRALQRGLALACLVCVICATYLSLRSVTLPEASLIDPAITQAEPVQELSNARVFTTTIKGYTYTLTPKATYDIAGLVVSQHRGDALFNLGHKADPGNIKDVCVVWGEAVTNGSYRKVKFTSGEFTCSYAGRESLRLPSIRRRRRTTTSSPRAAPSPAASRLSTSVIRFE